MWVRDLGGIAPSLKSKQIWHKNDNPSPNCYTNVSNGKHYKIDQIKLGSF